MRGGRRTARGLLGIIPYVAKSSCAPPAWEEKPQERQPARLDLSLCCRPGQKTWRGQMEVGCISSSPSWFVCLQAKAFADGFPGSLNVCWPEKLPPSMHSLSFPDCARAITSEGGPGQIKGFWSFPLCTQTFHLFPFLDIALLNEHCTWWCV